jgi:predicted transcriptional regulator
MTIMARLHRKGLLERRRNARGFVYAPRLSHPYYMEARARAEVGALVQEYGEVALVHFARPMAELDPGRRAQLRRLAGR